MGCQLVTVWMESLIHFVWRGWKPHFSLWFLAKAYLGLLEPSNKSLAVQRGTLWIGGTSTCCWTCGILWDKHANGGILSHSMWLSHKSQREIRCMRLANGNLWCLVSTNVFILVIIISWCTSLWPPHGCLTKHPQPYSSSDIEWPSSGFNSSQPTPYASLFSLTDCFVCLGVKLLKEITLEKYASIL